MQSYDYLQEKWLPVLNERSAGRITDPHRRAVTAVVLENTEQDFADRQDATGLLTEDTIASNVANWNPVLISLVRRAMPNLVAYDICGVQPMTGPTGLIFAMRSRYQSSRAGADTNDEALGLDEPVSGFTSAGSANARFQGDDPSGLGGLDGKDSDNDPVDPNGILDSSRDLPAFGDGMPTSEAETLGSGGSAPHFSEMGFSIESTSVTAKSRALKAEYTLEMAQDLKAIHGLDAENELANILATEVLAEINREVVRTINSRAKLGAQAATLKGVFDLSTDSDGRWSNEKYKGLGVQINLESNVIAKETRRGRGNLILCSSDVASALEASGMLVYNPDMNTKLNVDDTGNTYAGMLNGRTRVYIDPYATTDYVTVGFKGSSPYDAGIFYCPYVPLQMVRAVGENNFQPRLGFKTRYGMVANPFAGETPSNSVGAVRQNQYYRIFRVDNIL